MALIAQRLMADEKCFPGGVYDLWCEAVELVECLDAVDLGQQPVDEAEVYAGDADDGRDRCCVGEATLGVVC